MDDGAQGVMRYHGFKGKLIFKKNQEISFQSVPIVIETSVNSRLVDGFNHPRKTMPVIGEHHPIFV